MTRDTDDSDDGDDINIASMPFSQVDFGNAATDVAPDVNPVDDVEAG